MATSANAQYVYQPLPTLRSIRLLKILGFRQTMLSCSLETFDIDKNCPRYVALSYTWGPPFDTPECFTEYSPENDVEIYLQDAIDWGKRARSWFKKRSAISLVRPPSARIGRNLYEALIAMHHPPDDIEDDISNAFVWIDQLCINQVDFDERKIQVNLMGQIFSRANLVIIWLGNKTKDAMDVILDFHQGPFLELIEEAERGESPQTYLASQIKVSDDTVTIADRSFDEKSMVSLISFYGQMRWYQRAWTVQEAAVARRRVALCGRFTMDFTTMLRIAKFLCNNHILFEVMAGSRYAPEKMLDPDSGTSYYDIIRTFRRLRKPLRFHDSLLNEEKYTLRYLKLVYGATGITSRFYGYLECLLHVTDTLKVTDPRDHIYALLGMANAFIPDGSKAFVIPEYGDSLEHVFISFSQKCLQELPNLTLLSLAQQYSGVGISPPDQRLPSWVPDFTAGTYEPPLFSHFPSSRSPRPWNAFGKLHSDWPLLQFSGLELALRGARIDKVVTLLEQYHRPYLALKTDSSGPTRSAHTSSRSTRGRIYSTNAWFVAKNALRLAYEAGDMYSDGRLGSIAKVDAVIDMLTWGFRADIDPEALHSQFQRFIVMLLTRPAETTHPHQAEEHAESILTLLDQFDASCGLPNRSTIASISGDSGTRSDELRSEAQERQELFHDYESFLLAAEKRTITSKLMRSANGIIGICSDGALVGDEIWLLKGAKVPFVLRPTSQQGKYLLICECYVQGGMYGDLITSGLFDDEQEITLV